MKIIVTDHSSQKKYQVDDITRGIILPDFSFSLEKIEDGLLCKSSAPFYFNFNKIDLNDICYEFVLTDKIPVSIVCSKIDAMNRYTFELIND